MTEIELKLALPLQAAASRLRQLARLPLLAGCDRRRQQLHNIYFDTPERHLLQQGVVLRMRRVGSGASEFWLQTLKTGDHATSALSRRGEWESRLGQPELSAPLLADTPWREIDPHGSVFARLQPCFYTQFTRTRWTLLQADGCEVEVALDRGQIVAGTRNEPICELELELKAGQASGLFDIALQIARVVPVIPAGASKSERGYALAGAVPAGRAADRGALAPAGLARTALHTAWHQFTSNLIGMRSDDDPEPVHQARVAWRRFRTARRLFRPILDTAFPDVRPALAPFLQQLGAVRDLDVARAQSLPGLADAYVAGDAQRARAWQRMLGQLERRTEAARVATRQAIDQPAVGHALTRVTQWLEGLAPDGTPADAPPTSAAAARAWALRRLRRQHRALRDAQKGSPDSDTRQHQLRILAKRLRYGVDMLRPLLPTRRARRWNHLASQLQSDIGDQRDAMQATVLVRGLRGHAQIAEFLRGHAVAMAAAAQRRRPA